MVFDNTKIKRLAPDFLCTVPFSHGAEEIVKWYDADPARQNVSSEQDQFEDELVERFRVD
jgi:hypothetical protein